MSGLIGAATSGLQFANTEIGVGVNFLSGLGINLSGTGTVSSALGIWAQRLQPASFRGVPFVVRTNSVNGARRTALHEYPNKDVVYVEDLGRGARTYTFAGYLVGDDVFDQRDAMADACDQPGAGTLVHPSLGSRQATCVSFSMAERAELGRVVEIEFTFIEGPNLLISPLLSEATQFLTALRRTAMYVAAGAAFVSRVALALRFGSVVSVIGGLAVGLFGNVLTTAIGDARLIAGAVAGLQGALGRYSSGGLTVAQDESATPHGLLVAQVMLGQAFAGSVTSARGAMAIAPLTAPPSILAMMDAFRGCAISPRDQIRLLTQVARTTMPSGVASSSISQAQATMRDATVDLCQRAALASLAAATADYQPTSFDDAVAIRGQVCAIMDTATRHAADIGDSQTFATLRALRTAVAADLTARGVILPRMTTFTRPRSMPGLKLAYDLYGDASRADELTGRVDPPHPGFFPSTFRALAS
jgi:prophage DNA circulation protein